MGELAYTEEMARGIINKTPLNTMPGEDHQRCCGAAYVVDTFRVQYSSRIHVFEASEEQQAKLTSMLSFNWLLYHFFKEANVSLCNTIMQDRILHRSIGLTCRKITSQ